jgi:peptidoglycan-associated lipoprotein
MSQSYRATRGCVIAIATLSLAGVLGCQSARGGAPTAAYEKPTHHEPQASAEPAAPGVPALRTVFFDLDRWNLREDARATLKENARELQQSSQWSRLVVEGHCDERGSDEYNLALGERRAEIVSRYLKDLGIPAERLSTVSYGEDKPAARGHGEAAWSQNRRAELNLAEGQQASR